MRILSAFFVFFTLFTFPLSASAESLSENIAAFVTAGRNPKISHVSPYDFSPTTPEYLESGDISPFDTAEQPIAIFKIGKFNLTTYANTRPSFSLPLGKEATLGIKASSDSIQLRLKISF